MVAIFILHRNGEKLFKMKIRHVKLESAGDNNLILRVLSLKL